MDQLLWIERKEKEEEREEEEGEKKEVSREPEVEYGERFARQHEERGGLARHLSLAGVHSPGCFRSSEPAVSKAQTGGPGAREGAVRSPA